MSFRKRSDQTLLPTDYSDKTTTVIFIYKTDVEDDMDQQQLLSCALSYISENEEYDVICYRNDMWFGVTSKCLACIYIGFDQDDFQSVSDAIKLVDTKKWKLNVGFMMLENVYTKIIITALVPPESLFTKSKKWQDKVKTFKVIKVN